MKDNHFLYIDLETLINSTYSGSCFVDSFRSSTYKIMLPVNKFSSSSSCRRLYLTLLFFWRNVLLCHPGWNTVVQSQLIGTFASHVQVILVPQPLMYLGL